jgi:hypothetical protein
MAKNKAAFRIGSKEQRNIAPLDVVRNVAKFDAVLWQGTRSFSVIQKIGLGVLGFFFVGSGSLFLGWVAEILREERGDLFSVDTVFVVLTLGGLGALAFLYGVRLVYNLLFSRSTKNGGQHSQH